MSDAHDKALATVPTSEVAAPMSPIVSAGLAILQANPDPEALGKLLDMNEKWLADEARRMFAVALHALKADLPPSIVKRRVVMGRNNQPMYRHASLSDIMAEVNGPLERNGFTVTWSPACDGGPVSVTCELSHVGGHVKKATMAAPPDVGQNRNAVQGIGSTQTYLQRYTVCAVLGLALIDADDADQKQADPDAVNQGAALTALAAMKAANWTEQQCVDLLEGKPREQWTQADLNVLRKAYQDSQQPTPSEPAEPPAREPGDDGTDVFSGPEVDPNTDEEVPPA